MVFMEDIRSVSEFNRNTRAHIRRLNKTGRPEILTLNGKASVVIQDAAAYQKLLDQVEDARTAQSLAEIDRGETMPLKEAFALIRKRIAAKRASR
ncbi:MAG: type II toxin-antitoxin system Phd/YefM family antitoxin [Phycisphaerales bacterium]|nr:type II toxin-antitoxin system Phd/YefM family antitoxin [Phycisphaerales bacterium]